MKNFLWCSFVSILVAALWATLILAKPPKQDLNEEFSKGLGQIFADCEAIKPGTTRGELERNFEMEGGLCTYSEQRYVHRLGRGCVKIDVKFDLPERFPNVQSIDEAWKQSDKIIKISRPYLEKPIID